MFSLKLVFALTPKSTHSLQVHYDEWAKLLDMNNKRPPKKTYAESRKSFRDIPKNFVYTEVRALK